MSVNVKRVAVRALLMLSDEAKNKILHDKEIHEFIGNVQDTELNDIWIEEKTRRANEANKCSSI